ncbi:MAG: DUF3823 domain-containing protein [Bacteroidota bacterium]|nr:DUF3823 domain-containing protein [Bacteroidota bacterium]
MKFKHIIIYSFMGICLAFSACKQQDNYPTPNAGIEGKITDAATGQPFQTEQPNGVKIRLIEESYGSNVTPNDFWARADGSFENTQVFADKYKVVPIEGAFFPADTAEVNIKGLTNVDFKVVPFLTVTATAAPASGSVVVNYTISRSQVGGKIGQSRTLVSAYPTVSNTINEFSSSHDLSGTDDAAVLAAQYTDTISGLKSGSTYYVRVGAIAANANNKYNYSPVIKVTIP